MKFFNNVVTEKGTKVYGGVVGRLTKDPNVLKGREDKKDIAFFTIANNDAKETEFIQIKAFDNAVKACELIEKGCLVSIKGEFFKEKDGEGNEIEVLHTSRIEIFTYKKKEIEQA